MITDNGGGQSYTLSLTGLSGNGTIAVTLATLPTIRDLAGNDLAPFGGQLVIVAVGESDYTNWADALGLTPGVNDGFEDDPNGDGVPNIVHFAFDTDPLGNGSDEGKRRIAPAMINGDEYLTLTLPIRVGTTFSAGFPLVGTVPGMRYLIEGADDLRFPWTQSVQEVTPALRSGLPRLRDLSGGPESEWEYRTFRLMGPINAMDRG